MTKEAATTHPGLVARVKTRKAELEADLAKLAPADRARLPVEMALSQIEGLLGGNLDPLPKVVGEELSAWLEATKYIGEQHERD